jgi:uracil-DNA glycosylase family protein
VPEATSLRTLARAADGCHGCPLYANATHVVFGEGLTSAPIIVVGEQPGDQEDRQGRPFVGPAGGVLWRCVEAAGIDRSEVFVTNAVKHFKHEQRGKRRLHKKPSTAEVEACHPWLSAELRAVGARVLVALGTTAARSVVGSSASIAASRKRIFDVDGVPALVTYHPSAALRATDTATEIRQAIEAVLQHARRIANGDDDVRR